MSEINEQLQFMNESHKSFHIGDEIEGTIISKTNDGLILSIVGYKYEGIIPLSELTTKEDPHQYLDKLNIDDAIKAKVIRFKDSNNHIVLSRLEYEKEEALIELEDIFKNKKEITLKIKAAKENGLVAYYKGVRIFIPVSQIDVRFINDKSVFVNTDLTVRLIDFDINNPSRVVASRRVILEETQKEIEDIAWEKLNIGDVVEVEVKRFTNFGAFAEVYGIDGLIHLSQISWNHVKKAEDFLTKGQKINVKIIDMNRVDKKLSFSIKELTPEPWADVTNKYPINSIVLGKVVRLNDFGAFIELEPGIDGLVHISKISHDRINKPSDVLSVGEEVKAKILSVDEDNKRISLSIKDV